MKYIFILLATCFLQSCSSNNNQKEVQALALPAKIKSRVEIKQNDGTLKPVIKPGSQTVTILDPVTGKTYESKGWSDATKDNRTSGHYLKKYTFDQLIEKSRRCSAEEAVLIIDEIRSRRSVNGVKILAGFLNDTRKTVFKDRQQYWWYEKKGDAEKLEVRIYAALALQLQIRQAPRGAMIFIDYEQNLVYAIKEKFAVRKDDLAKVWLDWWNKNRKDYE